MTDKTMLVLPGRKMSVSKLIKRSLQVVLSVLLSAAAALALIAGSSMLVARGSLQQGFNTWLSFINRGDIQATMVLTAVVTVMFVYWQRDRERGGR